MSHLFLVAVVTSGNSACVSSFIYLFIYSQKLTGHEWHCIRGETNKVKKFYTIVKETAKDKCMQIHTDIYIIQH